MDLGTPRLLVLEFTKMSGAGNDFVVLDNRFYHFSDEELSLLAVRLCPRRTSVGADGLLALDESPDDAHDYRMVYVNADGSRASMCGNGARCLARFARLSGFDSEEMSFVSDAGDYRVSVPDDTAENVQLHMPDPGEHRIVGRPEGVGSGLPAVMDYIWTGTDHVVAFVDGIESIPVAEYGAPLRADPTICERGANVDFVEHAGRSDSDRDMIRVRTFERGVEGETLACGTGAVASVLVAAMKDQALDSPVDVRMSGGTLTVHFTRNPSGGFTDVSLEGPADVVYRGTLEI